MVEEPKKSQRRWYQDCYRVVEELKMPRYCHMELILDTIYMAGLLEMATVVDRLVEIANIEIANVETAGRVFR